MFQLIKKFLKKCNENIIPLIIVVPFIEVLVIESLHRRTLFGGIEFATEFPIAYIVNVMLLMAMTSLCLFFRERLFWEFLISFIWFLFGVMNYFILGNRVSPFSYNDIKVFSSVASIVRQYVKGWQLVAAIIILIVCIGFLVYLRIRIPKINRLKHIVWDILFFFVFMGCGYGAVALGQEHFETTGNITLTFLNNGFVYCFCDSVVDAGIRMPIGYGEEKISDIEKSLTTFNPKINQETTKKPNIIFVQLESFFDVNNMRNYSYSEDPMPCFHRLIKKGSSGLLTVPAFGAGTVNTEFEVLTGMSMDYFGLCEYPFKTVLKEQTCESLAYNLQEEGYATALIHNNRGTFYSRNQVYKNLGFDAFISEEFMNGAEHNAIDWTKDNILPGVIVERMKSTPEKDFIYTITVQSHGKYLTEDPETPYEITLTGEKDPALKNAFEYYINECRDVDRFIQDLILEINMFREDCIIVFFGDHLPTLDIDNSKLQYQNTYQTTYVIWDNIDLKDHDENMSAYQLSSYVLGKLGYKNGVLTRFHQKYKDLDTYERNLNMLQYDMLYGEKYIYGGVDMYEKSSMQYGIYPITIDHVRQGTDVVVVYGENFTEASSIYVDGKKKKTKFVNDKAILTYEHELEDGDRITVRQLTSTGGKIGNTEEYIYHAPETESSTDETE